MFYQAQNPVRVKDLSAAPALQWFPQTLLKPQSSALPGDSGNSSREILLPAKEQNFGVLLSLPLVGRRDQLFQQQQCKLVGEKEQGKDEGSGCSEVTPQSLTHSRT